MALHGPLHIVAKSINTALPLASSVRIVYSSLLQADRVQSGICEKELNARLRNRILKVVFIPLFLNFQGAKVHNPLDTIANRNVNFKLFHLLNELTFKLKDLFKREYFFCAAIAIDIDQWCICFKCCLSSKLI